MKLRMILEDGEKDNIRLFATGPDLNREQKLFDYIESLINEGIREYIHINFIKE